MKTRKHTARLLSRLCLCLTLCLVLLPLLSFAASADAASESRVIDYMGVMGDAVTEDLSRLAASESARCDVPLCAVVTRDASYDQDTFMSHYGFSSSDDLLLLIVFYDREKTTWYYDLYTFGRAADEITGREVDDLLDAENVYNNLKSGYTEAGLRAFFPLAAEAILTQRKAPVGKVVAFSLVGALLIGGVAVLIVVLRYRMKIKPTNYPLDRYATLKPGAANDVFTGSTVTSHTVSSSSGGGSGGGRGGGGGHRGGR